MSKALGGAVAMLVVMFGLMTETGAIGADTAMATLDQTFDLLLLFRSRDVPE